MKSNEKKKANAAKRAAKKELGDINHNVVIYTNVASVLTLCAENAYGVRKFCDSLRDLSTSDIEKLVFDEAAQGASYVVVAIEHAATTLPNAAAYKTPSPREFTSLADVCQSIKACDEKLGQANQQLASLAVPPGDPKAELVQKFIGVARGVAQALHAIHMTFQRLYNLLARPECGVNMNATERKTARTERMEKEFSEKVPKLKSEIAQAKAQIEQAEKTLATWEHDWDALKNGTLFDTKPNEKENPTTHPQA